MNEQFAQIPDFSDYLVSDRGYVINGINDYRIKSRMNRQNNLMVSITDDDQRLKTRGVALLVARAFVDLPEGPCDHFNTPINLNGNRADCRARNLAWRPRGFAMAFHKQFDYPMKHIGDDWPLEHIDTGEIYTDLRHISTSLGVLESSVTRSMQGFGTVEPFGWSFAYIKP
jgi:hypothetical protein